MGEGQSEDQEKDEESWHHIDRGDVTVQNLAASACAASLACNPYLKACLKKH